VLRVRCTTRLIPGSVLRDFFIAREFSRSGELVLSPRFVAAIQKRWPQPDVYAPSARAKVFRISADREISAAFGG